MKLNKQNTSELESGQPQGYYKEIQPKEENDLSEKTEEGMERGLTRHG